MRGKLLHAALAAVTVLCAALCAVFAYALRTSPAFERGEDYTFYMGASSSSLSVSSENPALDKLLLHGVAGESTRYFGDRYEDLKEKYRAELLFTEEACGVVNYYMYSPLLGNCVFLNGYAVNFHVAVGAEQTAAGTPLVFGGY